MADDDDRLTLFCGKCRFEIDFYNEWKKDTPKYHKQIKDYFSVIDDTTGSSDKRDGSMSMEATVPFRVNCVRCQTKIVVPVLVRGETLWDNNQIIPSQNINIISLPESAKPWSQFSPSFQCYIYLKIIAKTRMSYGYCYLGFHGRSGRILRPIVTTETNKCCWPSEHNFQLLKSYRFSVVNLPNLLDVPYPQPPTPYPHGYEDLLVKLYVTKNSTEQLDLEILVSIAKSDIIDIFPGVRERKFLYTNDITPSVGILHCKVDDLTIYQDDNYEKHKCYIVVPSGIYDLPITAIEYDHILSGKEALVVLGLARPFDGDGKFIPPRCYILIVGIFILK